MAKRKRKRRRIDNMGPLTAEELLVHRELQALRAAAWSVGSRNRSWVAERFRKLEDLRREVGFDLSARQQPTDSRSIGTKPG